MIQMSEERLGMVAGCGACLIWGSLVLLWRQLEHIPASELLAWRVLCSFAALIPVMILTRRWDEVKKALCSRKTLWRMLASTTLIGCNWFLYIWAVNDKRVLETSLGYYMTPLLSVAIGLIFLRERLSRPQLVALLLALSGVLWAVVGYGKLPWVGVCLAVSFGLYGLLRKTVDVEALPGLFVETVLMLPLAMLWLTWLYTQGQMAATPEPRNFILLALVGVLTATPLLLFAYSARHVPMTTLGFLQYISPTGSFLIGALFFLEPVSGSLLVTFAFIWIALIIQSLEGLNVLDGIENLRKRQKSTK